jgi:hypothetical protein
MVGGVAGDGVEATSAGWLIKLFFFLDRKLFSKNNYGNFAE